MLYNDVYKYFINDIKYGGDYDPLMPLNIYFSFFKSQLQRLF